MSDATDGPRAAGASSARRNPSVDDTAAFQRFYLDDQAAPAPPQPAPSLFHRLFVGWWRGDKRS